MVYYKQITNIDGEIIVEWYVGNKVTFYDGYVIDENNKTERNGYFWSDQPPAEYLEWINKQEQ